MLVVPWSKANTYFIPVFYHTARKVSITNFRPYGYKICTLNLLKFTTDRDIILRMQKKVSKQKRNLNKAAKKRERESFNDRYEQKNYADYKKLRKSNSFAECHGDLGNLLYSYSDARTWIDLPRGQKFRKTFVPQRIFLFALAILLCLWFLTALIYQLCTTANTGKTLLHLLPSFIIIVACTAILLISVFMGWGKFTRWAFKHNLVRGRDALSRKRLAEMKLELELADMRKASENRIDITTDYVVLSIYGKEEIYKRELVTAQICKRGDDLSLTLNIDGRIRDFPPLLPDDEYVPLKKALLEQLTVVRAEPTDKKELRKKLIKEIPAVFPMLLILAAGVMLVVAHYLWIKEIPPFLGVFFIGMSFLVLCNILSFIPAVNAVGIPLFFSLVLLVVPPWALVWFQQNVFHNGGNVLQIILNCDAFTAAFSFFTVIGAYVFSYAISKLIDYIRFSATK